VGAAGVTIKDPSGWLQRELGFLVQHWPTGDETALRADGEAWLTAARNWRDEASKWQSLAAQIAPALPGGTKDPDGAR
jgi:hypothetical protein